MQASSAHGDTNIDVIAHCGFPFPSSSMSFDEHTLLGEFNKVFPSIFCNAFRHSLDVVSLVNDVHGGTDSPDNGAVYQVLREDALYY